MRTPLVPVGLAAALLFTGTVPAQDKAADAKKQAEMMAAYAKAAAPGPQHKLLEPLAGKWTFTAKFWMDPSGPPMNSKGTAERKWMLGGRFLADDVDAAEFAGQSFKGFGVSGYDNLQQKYTGFWIDSMTTAMQVNTGTVDTSGKVFTYQTEFTDPLTKQKVKGRDVIKIEGNNKHSMEMYRILPDGKEMKVGEILYTRK